MYRVTASYKGFDDIDDFDRKLEKSVGKYRCGSGFSLVDGERDIAWVYRFEKDAKKAYNKLRRLKGISVEINDEEKD